MARGRLWRSLVAAAARTGSGSGGAARAEASTALRAFATAGAASRTLDGSHESNWSTAAAALAAVAAIGTISAGEKQASAEVKLEVAGDAVASANLVADPSSPDQAAGTGKHRGRRHLLKKHSKIKEKLEEVDLMKVHLDEYKKSYAAIDSLRNRFDKYASKTIGQGPAQVPAMTFTDFLHSLILPHFHTRSPNPEIQYSCDFVGNGDGLITFEECYLLIHLLQIPPEHFDVGFCMFDLDGNGAVDKAEFCHVIEHVLRVIAAKEGQTDLAISAEDTLPRLTKHLFGHFTKTITAQELKAALDLLRKHILRAEFDLYATKRQKLKNQEAVSVHDFAVTLISGFDPDKLPPFLERVLELNASDEVVTWDDFFKFHFNVQNNLKDIKLAFELTGHEITEAEFIRAARVVSGVELSFPVVQLAFRIFDSDGNGTLNKSELFKVLEMRNGVDLQQTSNKSRIRKLWRCITAADENP